MQSVSNDNFGPLVAYLVPGATVLLGLRPYFPLLERWFAATPPDAPTLGGFLYLTVASLAIGMTLNAIRWAVVDTIHALTGLPPPELDFSRLASREQAFALLIDIHYKHYQFHSSMMLATAIAYTAHRRYYGFDETTGWLDASALALELIFFLMSRDTLRKYNCRSQQLLASGKRPAKRPT